MSSSHSELAKGRSWYLIGGAFSAIIGVLAIARPGIASVAIEQVIGIFLIVSGVALLLSAIFGRAKKHRILDFLSSALRLATGILLIVKVFSGVLALTLIVATIFIVEGIFGVLFAFRFRGKNPAWIWMLLNGITAFILGGLLFAKFPSDAPWAIGFLFGLNSLFLGISLIMFALAMPKAREA